MSQRIYVFDLNALLRDRLSPLLRKPTMLALLQSLVAPLAALYAWFITFSNQRRRRVGLNGQTICLTNLLNEGFDPLFGEIYIQNHFVITDGIYLAHDQDPDQFVLGVAGEEGGNLATEAEQQPGAASFTVFVPLRLAHLTNDPALRAVVDFYKLCGTNYLVKTY